MSAKKKKVAGKAAKKQAKKASSSRARGAKAKSSAAKKPVAKKTNAKKLAAKAPKKAKKAAAKKVTAKKPGAKKAIAKKVNAKKALAKAPKKAAAKKSAPKPAVKKARPSFSPVTRRDGTGHLDPAYAAKLHALSEEENQKDDDRAFGEDALSDELGEEFVETVTSGEDGATELRDEATTEEVGGPFTVTSSNTEFAGDVDESNPEGATREPFPRS